MTIDLRHATGPMRFRLVLSMILLLIGSGAALAADVMAATEAFKLSAARGSDDKVELRFAIAPGTYLYRDSIEVTSAGQPLEVVTPPGTIEEDATFGRTEVYRNQANVRFEAPANGSATVIYRGCQEHGICYPPTSRTLDLGTLSLSPAETSLSSPQPSGWTRGGDRPQPPAANDKGSRHDTAAEAMAGSNWLLVMAAFAGFGLLLAFTPCVLPMYPILGGMLAGQGERLSAGHGFVVSLVYVLAMALAFGLLGVAAAWSGQNLQVALQSPLAVSLMSAMFGLLALSMFGLFELAVPSALASRVAGIRRNRRGSLGSAAILGFSSTLIVGPCVTPPLAAALVYVTQTGDMARGAAALFAMGLGQGIPLIVFGTFGASLLPKAGGWMDSIKLVFGFVFLGAAIWMLGRIVPPQIYMALWAALLIAAAVFAGAFDRLRATDGMLPRLAKTLGLLSALYGGLLAVGAATGKGDLARPLGGFAIHAGEEAQRAKSLNFVPVASLPQLQTAFAAADDAADPTLVYFTADWCVSCEEIKRNVLTDADVSDALENFRRIEIDLTDLDNSKRKLMKRFAVVGPPTMLFFGPGGDAGPTERLIGEMSPADVTRAALHLSPTTQK